MARPAETGHFHAVQFYQDQASLSSIVGGFIAEGFAHGDPALMIVTPEHRALIEAAIAHIKGQHSHLIEHAGEPRPLVN